MTEDAIEPTVEEDLSEKMAGYVAHALATYGYECSLVGFEHLTAFALNAFGAGRTAFSDKLNEFDVCVAMIYNGEKWVVSLYSVNPKIDVGDIAKAYGGGGHHGAAGFVCKSLPLRRKS